MTDNDTTRRGYLNARFAELTDALERGDGDAGVAVLRRMTADGYGADADQITNGLVAVGLRRLATIVETDGTGALSRLLPIPEQPTSYLSALGDQLKTGGPAGTGKSVFYVVDAANGGTPA